MTVNPEFVIQSRMDYVGHERRTAAVVVFPKSDLSLSCLSVVLMFSCSVFFQGIGNTWPSLASSAASVLLQGLCSCYLVRWQLRKKLSGLAAVA